MNAHAYIKVEGRVQGVGYRYYAMSQARALDLKGYVRNCIDGSVESEVEGDRESVSRYIDALRAGPSFARVHDVQVNWLEVNGRYRDFDIRF